MHQLSELDRLPLRSTKELLKCLNVPKLFVKPSKESKFKLMKKKPD